MFCESFENLRSKAFRYSFLEAPFLHIFESRFPWISCPKDTFRTPPSPQSTNQSVFSDENKRNTLDITFSKLSQNIILYLKKIFMIITPPSPHLDLPPIFLTYKISKKRIWKKSIFRRIWGKIVTIPPRKS